MPTASGRTMTSCGPGGPGSGTWPTTITPGDLVTAASICAGHSLRRGRLRVLVRGGAPGLCRESHPPAGRAMTPPPNPGRWLPGSRHKATRPALAEGTSPAGSLTIAPPGVHAKVVYPSGAGHGSASRLARAGSRTAWSAQARAGPVRPSPGAAHHRYLTVTASGYGQLMK